MKTLVGTWSLVEFKYENEAGQMTPWGTQAHGLLIYTDDGYMSLSVNNENDIFFYAGKYLINSKKQVVHQILNASNPERIGKELIRDMKLTDSELTLSAAQDQFGKGFIRWKKITA